MESNNKKEISRREFLRDVGVMGVAGVALGMFPWLKGCSTEASKEISGELAKLAVIGTGSRGMYHVKALAKLQGVELTAFCDTYEPNLKKAASIAPGARLYSNYRRLLEDKNVHGLIIATPPATHAAIAIEALDADKHVLCEKSMALSMEECKAMYDARKRSGRVMLVGQQRLFDPKYIRAMEMIRKGDIGQVVNIRNYWFRNGDWRRQVPDGLTDRDMNWRLYRELSRGLMTELACHQLQNGSWALGMMPEKVMGSGGIVYWKDGREVFDSVNVIYTFPNQVNMTFESVISNKYFGMAEYILGSEGTIELSKGRMFPEQQRPKTGIRQLIGDIEKRVFSNAAFAGTSWAAETRSSDVGMAVDSAVPTSDIGGNADGTAEMLMVFIHSVITGQQPESVLEEAYYASQFSILGDEAMLRGTALSLPDEFRI